MTPVARAVAPAADMMQRAATLDAALASAGSLSERLDAILRHADGPVAFSTSLGIEDQVILHAIAALPSSDRSRIDVFTLDTGRLFAETIETIATSEHRLGVPIRVVTPQAAAVDALVARDGVLGFRASIAARKACCEVRKVMPLDRALQGARVWITGLRREQSHGRGAVPLVQTDYARDLLKVAPLADWTLDAVERYADEHGVPLNPLHARGFPSIGCSTCTRSVLPGEDIRAGRWWWENEDGKECGLHSPNRPKSARM